MRKEYEMIANENRPYSFSTSSIASTMSSEGEMMNAMDPTKDAKKERKMLRISDLLAENPGKKSPTDNKKIKKCSVDGCEKFAQTGGVCIKHGAKVPRCKFEGCQNVAKKGRLCIRHGAAVARCARDGCTKFAVKGGVCVRHGAVICRCVMKGCQKQVPQKGDFCNLHAAASTLSPMQETKKLQSPPKTHHLQSLSGLSMVSSRGSPTLPPVNQHGYSNFNSNFQNKQQNISPVEIQLVCDVMEVTDFRFSVDNERQYLVNFYPQTQRPSCWMPESLLLSHRENLVAVFWSHRQQMNYASSGMSGNPLITTI